jgi:uncharacterized protein (TIGR02266 family)
MPVSALAGVKHVVIADDTAFVRDRFRVALETAGHVASTAASASDLLTHVREHAGQIDLVVLDLRLSHAHGIRLVRALRMISEFQAPIVIFSGTIANADEVRQLAMLGVAGYVNEYTASQHIIPSLIPHLFPDRVNRRSSPRVVTGLPVSYRVGNTIAAAVSLNISRGGVGVRTTSPPEIGTTVRLRLRLPGGKKEIDTEAQVRWIDRRLGMGLQFTRLDADDQRALDDFVQAHFFTNRKA